MNILCFKQLQTRGVLIMSNILVIWLFFMLNVSATVLGQQVDLIMANASLKDCIKAIEKQTELGFLYHSRTVNEIKGIDIESEGTPVNEILDIILENTGLSYEIEESVILIKPEILMNPFLPNNELIENSQPQQEEERVIIGRVTDNNGEPLVGVNIYVKGTTIGTISDINGEYSLKVPLSSKILVFSFVGFQQQEIKINDNGTINVILEESAQLIDELVVTGYQTLPKERITGSFSKIETEELDRNIVYNLQDKLEGNVGGMLNDPLGITIRGVSTLNASRVPLIVLDGFPLQIDLNSDDYTDEEEFEALKRKLETINPNDVQNITVLKDAAAASIWGARAANGVIVITTKHTSKTEPQIEFSTNFSFSPKPDINKMPFADPETYLEIEKGRYEAGWFDFRINNINKYLYNTSEYVALIKKFNDGEASQADLDNLEQIMGSYDNRYEFSDYFLRSKSRQQYNFSVTQNTGFNNYRFSFSYDDYKTASVGDENNRFNIYFMDQFKPNSWLTLDFSSNMNLINEKNNGIPINDLFKQIPQHERILDEDGEYTSMSYLGRYYGGKYHREEIYENNSYIPYDWEYNIKREFDNKNNVLGRNNFRLQGGITIKPFLEELFEMNVRYQYENSFTKESNLYNEETFFVRDKVNTFAQPDGTLPLPKGAIFDQFYPTSNSHTLRATTKLHKNLNEDHIITMLAGFEVREENSDKSNVRRYGYDEQSQDWAKQIDYSSRYPRNLYYNNSSYYIESAWSTIYNYTSKTDRYLSYFANASYSYLGKYDITGSYRIDKSNMFGDSPQYRDVPLWSVGGGWHIDKEEFFNFPFINRLRIRATYGQSGNVDKTTSPYAIASIGGSYTNPDLQLEGALFANPANPELRWEKTTQANIALDFSMFNNRLDGSIDFYSKNSSDLLTTKKINSTLGFKNALINFGEMKNRGVDLAVSAIIINKPLRWRSQIMYSYNENIVSKTDMIDINAISLSYILKPEYYNYRTQEGYPRFYLMSIPWGGLDENGYPMFYDGETLHHAETTTLKVKDYPFESLIYEGPMQSPHYGSWNNVLSYRRFELSFLVTYKFGHKYFHVSPLRVANNDLFGFAQGNFVSHYAEEFEERWKNPGDEEKTNIPKLPFEYDASIRYANFSSWYTYTSNFGSHQIQNAGLLRFDRITLSYSLPSKIDQAIKAKNIVFAIQARNLGYIAFNKYNEDPENLQDMYGNFILQRLPEYTFSLRMSF